MADGGLGTTGESRSAQAWRKLRSENDWQSTGRAGFARERQPDEGTVTTTRYEQRAYAGQLQSLRVCTRLGSRGRSALSHTATPLRRLLARGSSRRARSTGGNFAVQK